VLNALHLPFAQKHQSFLILSLCLYLGYQPLRDLCANQRLALLRRFPKLGLAEEPVRWAPDRTRLLVDVLGFHDGPELHPASGRLQVTLYGETAAVGEGQRVALDLDAARALLDRIEKLEPKIQAFNSVWSDRAMQQWRAAAALPLLEPNPLPGFDDLELFSGTVLFGPDGGRLLYGARGTQGAGTIISGAGTALLRTAHNPAPAPARD
jgi:hypothetical protein